MANGGTERRLTVKLDAKKFIPDERFSNHAVQGYSHPACPIYSGCFAQATGFGGGTVKLCDHFNIKECECDVKEGSLTGVTP